MIMVVVIDVMNCYCYYLLLSLLLLKSYVPEAPCKPKITLKKRTILLSECDLRLSAYENRI